MLRTIVFYIHLFLLTFGTHVIEQLGRAMHVIQTLNGNKGNAHFVSGKIK